MKDTIRTGSLYQTPVSQKLVDLIERSAEELTRRYIEDVKKSLNLPTYKVFDENELFRRAFRVYSQLGKWISQEASKEEIKNYWKALGRQRREEGFPLSEIILSLSLLRRHLWLKVQADGLMDTVLDLYQAMELNNRVVTFFDRAIYYAAYGYECQDKD